MNVYVHQANVLRELDFGIHPRAVYALKEEFWSTHKSEAVWEAVCARMEANPLVANRSMKIDYVTRKLWVYHGK
jgi:hypothetical protein